MKKKFLLTMFAVSIVLSGCGNTVPTTTETIETVESTEASETTQTETVESEPTEETSADINSIGDIQVEKELFDVTMILPADYVGDTTQEDLDALANEKGYQSIVLNDDGSATYTMTKSQHKALLQETADSINQSLGEMIGSETYPNFTDITVNSDFTSFTVTTKSTKLDMNESFSVMVFYMYGGFYAICDGRKADNIHVDFVNADSGEIISSSNSSDMKDSE
mgnify:FL=1